MVKTTYGIVGKDTNVSDKKCKIKTIYINQILDYYNNGIIRMPDFQRELDMDKVEEIMNTYIEYNKREENYFIKHGFTLSLCKIGENKELWVVDGQHRLKAMENLYPLGHNPYVMIRIELCETLDEMKNDYRLLNMNSDLPIVYTHFEDEFTQKTLIDIKNEYKSRYKRAFNSSKKETNHTNRLHIDDWISLLDPKLIKCGLEELDDSLKRINNVIAQIVNKNCDLYIKTRDKQRVNDTQFYLNLRNIKWVDHFLNGDDIKYIPCNYTKKTIPKSLRKSVFDRDFGSKQYVGNCYVCNVEINRDSSHIGHVKAECYGGKTVIDNLKAICITCNLSMGVNNMDDFKKEFFCNVD